MDFAIVKVCMGPPDTPEEVILVPARDERYHRLFVAHGFPSEQAVCLKAIPDILETVKSLAGLMFNLEMIKVSSEESQLTSELAVK